MFLWLFKGTIRKSFSGCSCIYSFDPAQLLVSQGKAGKCPNPAEKKTMSIVIRDSRTEGWINYRLQCHYEVMGALKAYPGYTSPYARAWSL